MTDPNQGILFLYDLPKDVTTEIKIQSTIKDLTGYDLPELPQIIIDPFNPFCKAKVRIPDTEMFNEIKQKLKYFEFEGFKCRALPCLKEFDGNDSNSKFMNLFVKGLPKDYSAKDLDKAISAALGGDHILSAKISINPDRTSRGYGFICLSKEKVDELLQLSQTGIITNF